MKTSKFLQDRRHRERAVAGITALGLALLIVTVERLAPYNPVAGVTGLNEPVEVLPDFAAIADVDVKKQQFFDYLEDYVDAENARIAVVRAELRSYADIVNSGVGLSQREREWVLELAGSYEVDTEQGSDRRIVNELMRRVDVIPPSLALAQAATESAWGTSRFTLEGNNLFGQWCYREGCGIVPQQRPNGEIYEVQRFASIEGSVAAYIHNINTHHLYQEFREARASMRRDQERLDSFRLAYELGRYSERGEHYIDEVQTIIEQNGLRDRDRVYIQG